MDTQFPTAGLMPKGSSGVASFLERYKEYNGTGVIVAVFDTGCDVAAAGLQFCPDGSPKFIDAIDTTGSGDVDMSLCVEPKDNTLIGLTGRTLKLNPEWKNPTGKFYIGIKQLNEISPGTVRAAINEDRTARRTFALDTEKTKLETQIKQIQEEIDSSSTPASTDSDQKKLNLQQYLTELKLRLDMITKYFSTNNDSYGPVFDCILWHNGTEYCAAIDTLELGDFTHPQVKVLRDYASYQEYSTFSYVSQFTYSVKIYAQDPSHICLSIVVAGGTHGSHVASIVGSYWGENDTRNGNASGCKLVSVKIGDSFLSTMETQSGILRGLLESVYTKCDLVNMSYGEATTIPNSGAISTYLNEIVTKYGVIFVSSNGNEGPCLTTAGAPGGTSEHSISVAAAIEPEMMEAQYSIKQKNLLTPKNYHWSSRGPTFDGAMPSISALGAAYASVPRYNTQLQQQMNGTSMSSPSCCGILALALSAMKAKGYKYTVHRIRHAMEQSATFLKDNSIFAQGNGLIQIENMWRYLQETIEDNAFDLHYRISIQDSVASSSATSGLRGIYIRAPDATKITTRWICSINPEFPRYQYEIDQEKGLPEISIENGEKNLLSENNNTIVKQPINGPLASMPRFNKPSRYSFSRCVNFQFKLGDGTIHKDLPWVEMSKHTVLTNSTKSFPIMIHPQKLPPGPHFVWAQAILAQEDPSTPYPTSAGRVLFQIPITVIVPTPSDLDLYKQQALTTYSSQQQQSIIAPPLAHTWTFTPTLTPLHCPTYFVQVPIGASFVTCTITALEQTPSTLALWLSTNTLTQLKDDEREFEVIRLSSEQHSQQVTFPVTPDRIMEFALMYPWTAQGTGIKAKIELAFYGVSFGSAGNSSRHTTVTLPSCNTPLPVPFTAIGTFNGFLPKIVLNTARMILRPSKFNIFKIQDSKIFNQDNNDHDQKSPYSREILPHQSTMWGMIIEYSFKITGSKAINGSFDFNQGSSWLYESAFSSQNVRVYDDATKKLFHTNDSFPSRRYKDYPAGSYTAHVFLKHTNKSHLNSYSNATASFIAAKLPIEITIPVRNGLEHKCPQLKAVALQPQHIITGVVFPNEAYDKIIEKPEMSQFDTFYGSFTPLPEDNVLLNGLDHKKIGVSVEYNISRASGEGIKKDKKNKSKEDDDNIVPYALSETLQSDSQHIKAMAFAVKKDGKKDKKDSADSDKKNDGGDDDKKNDDEPKVITTGAEDDEDVIPQITPIKILNQHVANWSLSDAPVAPTSTQKYLETFNIKALEAAADTKTDDVVIIELYNTMAEPMLKTAHFNLFEAVGTKNDKKIKESFTTFTKLFNITLNLLSSLSSLSASSTTTATTTTTTGPTTTPSSSSSSSSSSLPFLDEKFKLLRKIFNPVEMLTQVGIYSQRVISERPNVNPLFPKTIEDGEDNNDDNKDERHHPSPQGSEELQGLLQLYSTLHLLYVNTYITNFITTFTALNIYSKIDQEILNQLETTSNIYTRYKTAMVTTVPSHEKNAIKKQSHLNALSDLFDDLIIFFKTFITSTNNQNNNTIIGYASLIKVLRILKFDDDKKDPVTIRARGLVESLFKPIQAIAVEVGLGGSQNTKPCDELVKKIKAVTVKDGAVSTAITEVLIILTGWTNVEALSANPDLKLTFGRPGRFF